MNIKFNTKAGFSLVELMVVVAIIGILASIAIPNFTKFQNKAKQSGAKTMLSAIYSAEQAFFAEQSSYHPNLPHIGFVPDGVTITAATNCPDMGTGPIRQYSVGFGVITAAPGVAPNQVIGTAGTPGCITGAAAATNGESYYAGTSPGTVGVPSSTADGATAGGTVATGTTFTALASGVLQAGSTRHDVWSMTNAKALTNAVSGL